MISSFFIALREGLEAFLIVGIIISYLFKVKERRYIKYVILGVTSAIVLSILIAFIFGVLFGKLEEKAEEIFEGSVMLLAVVILTYMIFWMNAQSRKIRSDIEISVDRAIAKKRLFSLFFLGFIVVLREGAETVLFFRAISFRSTSKELIMGAALGILLSLVVSALFFVSSIKIRLDIFFKVTGILILFIAAGLLSTGIHEFQEAGTIPIFKENIFDLSHILSKDSVFGGLLKSIFGYNPSPSLLEISIYFSYLILVFLLLRKFFFTKKLTEPKK